jgi:2-dehydropantoate 2-reductase
LENTLQQLAPCIDEHTVIIPLLNGVDSVDRIKSIYPQVQLVYGCVYLVAHLKESGVVENSGTIQKLFFGQEAVTNSTLERFEILLRNANIDVIYSTAILKIIWEKFIFIAPIATASSYFNAGIGKILDDSESKKTITLLIEEVNRVAQAIRIATDPEIVAMTLKKMESLPAATTSSMHRDFTNGKSETELESLTGYVIGLGEKLNCATPTFQLMYQELRKRQVV